MKRNVIVGILLVLLGFSLLGNIAQRGAVRGMAAYARQEAAQAEAADSTDSTVPEGYDRFHGRRFKRDGRFGGSPSFFFAIPRLLVLGLGGYLLFKYLRRRQDGDGDIPPGKIIDDFEDGIVLNPDADTKDDAPPSGK